MIKQLKQKIINLGGFVNTHAHFDRAYTSNIFSDQEKLSHLHAKWKLNDKYKKSASLECYKKNLRQAIESQINFGVTSACTFVDVDSISMEGPIVAASHAKLDFKDNFDLKIACQTIKGVVGYEERKLIEMWMDSLDIIGSLPAADVNIEKHLDIVMGWAKDTGKRLHVHVDQLNSPKEKETELLARKTIEHGLQGRVTAVHALSLACHPQKYRNEVYELSKDAGLSFISCPSAWIDHPRREDLVPSHNAITPVDELIKNDLIVAIGSDNIQDIYKPFADGDMMFELRLLLEACKIYNEDVLIKIATSNGFEIIN